MRRHLRDAAAGILGPGGAPARDELAHRDFRRRALGVAPRVVWEFPLLDGIEFRDARLEDVLERVKDDPNHPVSLEVARLMRAYLDAFRRDLLRMARHYNPGEQPQVGITRRPPRCPVEHVAQHLAAVAIQDVLTDATEETPLLHPDAKP